MHVEVRDGKVVQVVANTRGLAFQNEILEALSGKFGDPASVARDFVRDSSGSAFQSLRVQWRLPTGSLRMLGAESSPDKGAIYLSDR